jgi:hypothetical protein
MLLRLRGHPEMHDRLLFGTDYPHLVFRWPCRGRAGEGSLRDIGRTDNRFDKQYLFLKYLGVGCRSLESLLRSSA